MSRRRTVRLVTAASAAALVAAVAWTEGARDAHGQAPIDPGAPLPPGHPPTTGAAPATAAPQAAPPGTPPGHPPAAGAPSQMLQPPQDQVNDDRTLPVGTVMARIQTASQQPIPNASVKLAMLTNSVAKGETRDSRTAQSSAEGLVRFDGLNAGTQHTYRVIVQDGAASFASAPFSLTQKTGKQVVLHVYEVVSDVTALRLGMDATVFIGLKDDTLQVEHMFNVFNLDPRAWLANTRFKLPDGFKAFSAPEDAVDPLFFEDRGHGAVVRGTVKPGRHSGTFRYSVDLDGDDEQTLRIELPPLVKQVRVVANAGKGMTLDVDGFPKSEKVTNNDGRRFLMTQRMVDADESGVAMLEVTLSGLPVPGYGRWLAVGLGALAIAGGFGYAFSRREDLELPEDTKQDLLEAREALLDELVTLERAHVSGEVGPRSYARLRKALLDALTRILGQLEARPSDRVGAKARHVALTAQPIDENDDDENDDDENDDDENDDDENDDDEDRD